MVLCMKQLKLIRNVHRICYQSSKVNYWIQRKIHQNMNLSVISKSWNGHGDHFICPLHNQRIRIENYKCRGDGRYRRGWVTPFISPFKIGWALVIIHQIVIGHVPRPQPFNTSEVACQQKKSLWLHSAQNYRWQ